MRICLAGNDHVWRVAQTMKIHLADARYSAKFDLLKLVATHPYRLVSYFYARELKDPGPRLQAMVHNDTDLVMDSGLYSLMFGSEQGKMPSTYEAYRDYTRRYLDDLDKWGVDCFLVEADTQRLLGMEATLRLREEFAPLGSRVMYVWHYPEGFDGLVKLAQEKDYICLSIPELRMIASGGKSSMGHPAKVGALCNDLLRRVHKACGDSPPRIHLLGCTVMSMIETRLAWSCDSTSWLSGIRFGNGVIWTSTDGLQSCGMRSPRFKRFVEMAMDAHPEAVDFARQQTNVDYYLSCLACAHAYALYQRHLDASYSPVPMRGDALPGGPLHDPAASNQGKARRTASDRSNRLA